MELVYVECLDTGFCIFLAQSTSSVISSLGLAPVSLFLNSLCVPSSNSTALVSFKKVFHVLILAQLVIEFFFGDRNVTTI